MSSTQSTTDPVVRRVDVVPLLAYMTFAAGLGWQLGQDANWDLRNYHFYNVFMWLTDRFERDIHAAGIQTFLNPALDLPLYVATTSVHVPPLAFGLALSAAHGLLLFFVHRIATLVLAPYGSLVATVGGVIAAVTAAFGAAVHAEIGSTMGDNTVGVLVLGALTLLLTSAHAGHTAAIRASRLAGLLVGLASGAKLVAGIYAFGLLTAALVIPGTTRARLWRAIHFTMMLGLGIVLTGGYWMWHMQEHFASPLFPFYNAVFESPLAPYENFSDAIYKPQTWQAAIALPFYFFTEQKIAAETFFRDGRLAVSLVSLATVGVVAAYRWLSGRAAPRGSGDLGLRQLAAFFVVSYLVWLGAFALYRYAIPLEALSGVLVISCAVLIARDQVEGLLIAVPTCALLILSTKALGYERIGWTDTYFGVSRDRFTQYENAVVLLPDFPTAYSLPFFPPSTTFLRISSNWGLVPGNQMWQRLQERIAAAPGERLYWLEVKPYATDAEAEALLNPFNIVLQSSCDEMITNFEPLRICRLARR